MSTSRVPSLLTSSHTSPGAAWRSDVSKLFKFTTLTHTLPSGVDGVSCVWGSLSSEVVNMSTVRLTATCLKQTNEPEERSTRRVQTTGYDGFLLAPCDRQTRRPWQEDHGVGVRPAAAPWWPHYLLASVIRLSSTSCRRNIRLYMYYIYHKQRHAEVHRLTNQLLTGLLWTVLAVSSPEFTTLISS